MDMMTKVPGTYTPKPITVSNLDELSDVKAELFQEVQRLAEGDRLSDSEIDRLYSISDKLVSWQPELEEEK